MTRQRNLLLLASLLGAPSIARAQRSAPEVELRGTILFSGFHNSGRVNNADVPTVALLGGVPGQGSLGATVRQTRFGVVVRHEAVLGGRLFGELEADFFGGQQPSGGGRTHPLLRIRRAYGEIRWTNGSLLVGQEVPPLFAVNPRSIASVGFPMFASAGNLWLWLPQIRATGWLTGASGVRVGIEGTLLAPSAGEPVDPFLVQPDRAELTERPGLEGRVLARWQAGESVGEVGVGAHAGWSQDPSGKTVSSSAFGISWLVPLGRRLEIRGEYFRGRGLAGLGGGGIGQNFTTTGSLVRTKGGWIQGVVMPAKTVELALGYGTDDPEDRDLPATVGRYRNRSVGASATWRVAPLVGGVEIRRLQTDYRLPGLTVAQSTHLNVGVGIEF